MSHKKISVVIPIYNAEQYIVECLDSIVFQTLEEIEIICIDDGSTDGSLALLKDYQTKDDRIIILEQENKGSGPARNLGIEHSSGKYILFVDADDHYPNNEVFEMLYKTAETTNANICGGSMDAFGEKKTTCSNPNSRFMKEGWIFFSDFQWDYEFYRYIYRKSFLLENKLLFPSLRRYQDPPFLLEAMICAKKFYAIRESTYSFRVKREDFDSWTAQKACDLANGLYICLRIAVKNHLDIVFDNNLNRVNTDFRYLLVRQLENGNKDLINILVKINELVKKAKGYEDGYQIDPLRIAQKRGRNYSVIKRGIFFGMIRSLKENGVKYTLDRILFHLHLKKDNDPNRTVSKL